MCQYSAEDGCATDWHLMHWGNLLSSGGAMFTNEATAVLAEARITRHCLGLWDDRTATALAKHLHRALALARRSLARTKRDFGPGRHGTSQPANLARPAV